MKYLFQFMYNEKVYVVWMCKQKDFVFDIVILYFSVLEKLYIMLSGGGGGGVL